MWKSLWRTWRPTELIVPTTPLITEDLSSRHLQLGQSPLIITQKLPQCKTFSFKDLAMEVSRVIPIWVKCLKIPKITCQTNWGLSSVILSPFTHINLNMVPILIHFPIVCPIHQTLILSIFSLLRWVKLRAVCLPKLIQKGEKHLKVVFNPGNKWERMK